MNEALLKRVNDCKRTFMLSELVDLQRVQSVRMPNDVNFCITQVSGIVVYGDLDQFSPFMDKYMSYLESKQ